MESATPEKKRKKIISCQGFLLYNWRSEHHIFQNWHLFYLKENVYGVEVDKAINGLCGAEAFNQLQKLFTASILLHHKHYCSKVNSFRHQHLTEDVIFLPFVRVWKKCDVFLSLFSWHFEMMLTLGMWLTLDKWQATQSTNNSKSKFLVSGKEKSSSSSPMLSD